MPLTRSERDKWAEELESGRWKQAHGILSDGSGIAYCCLGVLWYKVQIDPFLLGNEGYNRFCEFNDTDKLSFPEIAKHVRALPVREEETGT